MNILLVEDEYLARAELSHLLQKDDRVSIVWEAETIQEALKLLLSESIDIAFLDIHLTDESGMDLADMIKDSPNPPVIIFATAYDNYAIEAFEKNARDYILKPFEEKRVKEALNRAVSQLESNAEQGSKAEKLDAISVHTDDRIYLVKIKTIAAVEATQGKTLLYTDSEQFETKETLQYWEQKLIVHSFMRVHRAFIINLDKISEIEPWFNQTYQVTLQTGMKVPVSRSYIKTFKEKLHL